MSPLTTYWVEEMQLLITGCDHATHFIQDDMIISITDYGRPMKHFFIKIQKFGHGQTMTIWAVKFWGIWGILDWFISTYFGTVSPCFPLFNHYFYKNHPNICLELGFEFGPQRIRDLAIVCPWSVISIMEAWYYVHRMIHNYYCNIPIVVSYICTWLTWIESFDWTSKQTCFSKN